MIPIYSQESFSLLRIESIITTLFREYPDIIGYYMEIIYAIGGNEILRGQLKEELFQFNELMRRQKDKIMEDVIIERLRGNILNSQRNWKGLARSNFLQRKEALERNEDLLSDTLYSSFI